MYQSRTMGVSNRFDSNSISATGVTGGSSGSATGSVRENLNNFEISIFKVLYLRDERLPSSFLLHGVPDGMVALRRPTPTEMFTPAASNIMAEPPKHGSTDASRGIAREDNLKLSHAYDLPIYK